jgi:hypothetical protein
VDRALEEAIKAAEVAVDYHTVENRNKRMSGGVLRLNHTAGEREAESSPIVVFDLVRGPLSA